MAKFECSYYARTLARDVAFCVLLPDEKDMAAGDGHKQSDGLYRTLYVLHGGLEDCHAWICKSNIGTYVDRYGLAVVSISYENSYLTDLRIGQQYFTWMTEDLIPYVRRIFPLSDRREDNFVAGTSMGGYCAAKLALRRADLFSGLAIFSGAVDTGDELKGKQNPMNFMNPFFKDAFGTPEQYRGSENDVVALLRGFKNHPQDLPKIFQCCGTEDALYIDNSLYRDEALKIGADITWVEKNAGHTWDFWNSCMQEALRTLTGEEMAGN